MEKLESLKEAVLSIDADDFESLALQVFRHQALHNPLYARFVAARKLRPEEVTSIRDIPFLPISFFKHYDIRTGDWQADRYFESSGTTGAQTSRHALQDPEFYKAASAKAFEAIYGPLDQYRIAALLPSYLERGSSSLVFMAEHFIRESGSSDSGFFLDNTKALNALLQKDAGGRKTLLLGVSFALLDFAEAFGAQSPDLLVMETGGMKGRRREMIREELHEVLCSQMGLNSIHSEYGMTELMSQAYAPSAGLFQPAPWMRILIRDVNDPLSWQEEDRTGGINIIDLANLHSCSFIETSDLGKAHPAGKVEILGRFDNSDIRGCNLLI